MSNVVKASVRLYLCCTEDLPDNNPADLCCWEERMSWKKFETIIISHFDCQSKTCGIFMNSVGDLACDCKKLSSH